MAPYCLWSSASCLTYWDLSVLSFLEREEVGWKVRAIALCVITLSCWQNQTRLPELPLQARCDAAHSVDSTLYPSLLEPEPSHLDGLLASAQSQTSYLCPF